MPIMRIFFMVRPSSLLSARPRLDEIAETILWPGLRVPRVSRRRPRARDDPATVHGHPIFFGDPGRFFHIPGGYQITSIKGFLECCDALFDGSRLFGSPIAARHDNHPPCHPSNHHAPTPARPSTVRGIAAISRHHSTPEVTPINTA